MAINNYANWTEANAKLGALAPGWSADPMSQADILTQFDTATNFSMKCGTLLVAGMGPGDIIGPDNKFIRCTLQLNPDTKVWFVNAHTVNAPNGPIGGGGVYDPVAGQNNNGVPTLTIGLNMTALAQGDYGAVPNNFVFYRRRSWQMPWLLGRATVAAPHAGPNGTVRCTLAFPGLSVAQFQALMA